MRLAVALNAKIGFCFNSNNSWYKTLFIIKYNLKQILASNNTILFTSFSLKTIKKPQLFIKHKNFSLSFILLRNTKVYFHAVLFISLYSNYLNMSLKIARRNWSFLLFLFSPSILWPFSLMHFLCKVLRCNISNFWSFHRSTFNREGMFKRDF